MRTAGRWRFGRTNPSPGPSPVGAGLKPALPDFDAEVGRTNPSPVAVTVGAGLKPGLKPPATRFRGRRGRQNEPNANIGRTNPTPTSAERTRSGKINQTS